MALLFNDPYSSECNSDTKIFDDIKREKAGVIKYEPPKHYCGIPMIEERKPKPKTYCGNSFRIAELAVPKLLNVEATLECFQYTLEPKRIVRLVKLAHEIQKPQPKRRVHRRKKPRHCKKTKKCRKEALNQWLAKQAEVTSLLIMNYIDNLPTYKLNYKQVLVTHHILKHMKIKCRKNLSKETKQEVCKMAQKLALEFDVKLEPYKGGVKTESVKCTSVASLDQKHVLFSMQKFCDEYESEYSSSDEEEVEEEEEIGEYEEEMGEEMGEYEEESEEGMKESEEVIAELERELLAGGEESVASLEGQESLLDEDLSDQKGGGEDGFDTAEAEDQLIGEELEEGEGEGIFDGEIREGQEGGEGEVKVGEEGEGIEGEEGEGKEGEEGEGKDGEEGEGKEGEGEEGEVKVGEEGEGKEGEGEEGEVKVGEEGEGEEGEVKVGEEGEEGEVKEGEGEEGEVKVGEEGELKEGEEGEGDEDKIKELGKGDGEGEGETKKDKEDGLRPIKEEGESEYEEEELEERMGIAGKESEEELFHIDHPDGTASYVSWFLYISWLNEFSKNISKYGSCLKKFRNSLSIGGTSRHRELITKIFKNWSDYLADVRKIDKEMGAYFKNKPISKCKDCKIYDLYHIPEDHDIPEELVKAVKTTILWKNLLDEAEKLCDELDETTEESIGSTESMEIVEVKSSQSSCFVVQDLRKNI